MTALLKHRLSDLSKRGLFLTVVFLLQLCICSFSMAADEQSPPARDNISVHIHPEARTIIFNEVAVLPFLSNGDLLDIEFTKIFYQALQESQKYKLLPTANSFKWFEKKFSPKTSFNIHETVITAGRELQTRGVITGRKIRNVRKLFPLDETNTHALKYVIQMTDVQTERNVWSLTILHSLAEKQPTLEENKKAAQSAVQALLTEMVRKGDIFSPHPPQPRVLSSHGEIRKVRIVLQPDPPHIFSAYQLLRAENEGSTFKAVGKPVANDKASLILKDSGLEDGKTYFYTIIGITAEGLTNIPGLPFQVTTTGPPKTVAQFHAAGNTLRHIRLFWEPSQDSSVNGYVLYRSNNQSGPFTRIATINGRERQTHIDDGQATGFSRFGNLRNNTEYFYTIRTRNIVGLESLDSKVISATTKGAPLPPSEIQAIDGGPRKIPLAWVAADDPDIKGYAIFRSTQQEGSFKQIDYVSGRQQQQYEDRGTRGRPLTDNTSYFYKIQSVNVVDIYSADSTMVSATTKAAPAAVSGVTLISGMFRSVGLKWLPNLEPDIVQYDIFRGDIADSVTEKIATIEVPVRAFTDSNLKDGQTYWYRIRTIDRDKLPGELSEAVKATTKPTPNKPSGLIGKIMETGVQLSWKDNPEQDIIHYEIVTAGFLSARIGTPTTSRFFHETKLEPGKTFRFQIRAVDQNGLKSPYSDPVAITVPDPLAVE